MPWFEREEPLHERLAREGGIEDELDEGALGDELDEEEYEGDQVDAEAPADTEGSEGPLEPPPVLPYPPSDRPQDGFGMDDFLLRPGGYDAFAWTHAPGIAGNRVEFVVLPDRSLIVLQQSGDEPLDALATAVETQVAPPYRARALKEQGDRWSVYAHATQIVALPGIDADQLELTVLAGEGSATVEGDLTALHELAEERGYNDFFAQAEWLDGDLWEVRLSAL